jgi:predicted CoA-binding protein
MAELDRLAYLLDRSGDRENPGPEGLRRLLARVRTLAVVGISRDPLKPARRVPSYLAAKGMEVIPVNPHAEWLLGQPVRARLLEVTEPVDLVLLFRPSGEVGPLIRESALRPERPAIWLQEGIRDDEAAGEARGQGILVVQDLCLYLAHRALAVNRPEPIKARDGLFGSSGRGGGSGAEAPSG